MSINAVEFSRQIFQTLDTGQEAYYLTGPNGIYIANKLATHPLLTCLSDRDSLHIESNPKDITPGDVMLFYYGDWQLGVVTKDKFLGTPILCTDPVDLEQIPLASSARYRVGRGMSLDVPDKLQLPPDMFGETSTQPFIIDPLYDVTKRSVLINNEDPYRYRNKPYVLQRISDISRIEFEGDKPILAADYLYQDRRSRIPIIISDFHQKLPYHIGALVSLGLLPNEKSEVDWLDKHDDGDTERNNFQRIVTPGPHSLEKIAHLVRAVDCGQAASLTHYAGIADIRFFRNISPITPPSWGTSINPFIYRKPFARTSNRPHLLSLEADHIPVDDMYLSTYRRIDTDELIIQYLRWLEESGMTRDNYDAIFIYTAAPHYARQDVAARLTYGIIDLLSK